MKHLLLTVVLTLVCTVLSAAPPSDFVIRLLNGVTLENATVDSKPSQPKEQTEEVMTRRLAAEAKKRVCGKVSHS